MPSTTAAPPLLIDPPFAGTLLTVVNSRAVSYSQSTEPSRVEYARSRPSIAPENTTPGIPVTAAFCDGLHGFLFAHPAPGTLQRTRPVRRSTAFIPPLAPGLSAMKSALAA